MRVYMYGTGTPKSVEANEVLLNIVSEKSKAKEKFGEEEYGNWIIALHNDMRAKMGLPNMLFTIVIDKEHKNAQFIFFDREPDGKHYEVFMEEKEEGITFYIEVEE